MAQQANKGNATQGAARQPYAQAKAANFGNAAKANTKAAATLVKSAKGTNPKRNKVFGYDNGANGGNVPANATIVLVPGASATQGSAAANLLAWVSKQPKGQATVANAKASKQANMATKGGGIGRTIRRAYRKGLIRFAQ